MPKYSMVLAPDLGLMDKRLDTQIVSSKVASNMRNMRKWGNYIGQRAGRISFGSVTGVPVGYYHFNVASITRFMVFTTTNIYYRATASWTDITGTDLTGAATDYVDACMAYDATAGTWYVVFTNNNDNIRKYTGAGNTSDMSGWTSYDAKFVRYYKGHLVCGYITTGGTIYPFRIMTSNTDYPNDLTGNARTFNLTQDKGMTNLMALELFDDYIVAYKTDSIYVGYLKGDATDIFAWDIAVTGVGLRASRAVAITPEGHYFLGYDNIYYWNNVGTRPVPIASNAVRYRLFEGQIAQLLPQADMVYDTEDNQIRLYLPDDTIYVYDISSKSWWQERIQNVNAVGTYFRDEAKSWSDYTEDWDETTDRYNDRDVSDNFPIIVEGLDDGTLQYINTTTTADRTIFAIDSYFDTADRIYESGEMTEEVPYNYKRIFGIRFQAKGADGSGVTGYMEVYYSTDEGATWTQVTTGLYDGTTVWTTKCPLSEDWEWYEAHFDVSTRSIRFRFRNQDIDSTFFLRKWIEIYEELAWEG